MKLYKVIIYKNGVEQVSAKCDNLEKLERWALSCQQEDTGITFEIYEEV